jgi:hypothetical protein
MEQINANEIRKIIVEELGALKYAEIKNVRDSLNSDFIKKELESFKKQKKLVIFRSVIFGLMAAVFAVQAMIGVKWLTYIYLIIALLAASTVGSELGSLKNKITIYKILDKLSNILKNVQGSAD